MSQNESFRPSGKPFTIWYESPGMRLGKWKSIDADKGCAFDFLLSSAIIEWLGSERIVEIADSGGRFQGYRRFSRLADPSPLISQLVLYDKIYLNIGMYYKQNTSIDALKKYGFFVEYPRPPEQQFLSAYQLIKPLALHGIKSMLTSIVKVPFEELWTPGGADTKDAFMTYEGLIEWLYNEYAKDACGLESHELALFPRIKPKYVDLVLDFMEYVVHAQGCLASGQIPVFSSVLRPIQKAQMYPDLIRGARVRDDVFALYQVASSSVLGYSLSLRSFDDILRLREDKRIHHVRKLLGQYHRALHYTDTEVMDEITKDMKSAKRALDRFQFTERPIYTYVMKTASYLPVAGTLVSLVNDAVDLVKEWNKRKNGWIYFGLS